MEFVPKERKRNGEREEFDNRNDRPNTENLCVPAASKREL